jgi:glucose/arabinose dehydrogenase
MSRQDGEVTRPPALLAAIGALLLVATACGSGDADESFGVGQPATTVEPATTAAEPTTTEPATTDDPSADPTVSPPADTTTPSSTTPGPLAEPTVSLFEVGSFDQPVDVIDRPGDGTIYVVEQPGRVVAATDLSSDLVLDITDLTDARGEQGLLGLAFHPTDDLAYVHYTDLSGDTVVAELSFDPATAQFDRASLREVLTVDQPYSNHNGGRLAFGPDQLLYIALGDGGSGGDPERSSLNLASRLGKILRIDPVATENEPFTVPSDNPFVDLAGADPTVWSYGLRNPWKFSFDPDNGDLWIADVGQGDFEEINHSVATDRRDAGKGVNFGWSAFEGFERFNDDQPAEGATPPLFVYDHGDGRCSVSGGTVARGDNVADLAGWYLFGDFCSGQIWALDPSAPPSEPRVVEIAQIGGLVAIAEGPDRELYAVSNGGTVARLVPG